MRTPFILLSTLFVLNACNIDSQAESAETGKQEVKESIEVVNTVGSKKEVIIEKELIYDLYTLEDSYPYKDTVRVFQWDQIKEKLAYTDLLHEMREGQWGIIQNKRDIHGTPPPTKVHHKNEYNVVTDEYGVDRNQAAPLYSKEDKEVPERYGYDGTLIKILGKDGDFVVAHGTNFDGEYLIPEKYIHYIQETPEFIRAIVIDRTNQNIATFEKQDGVWKVRSMNPCTTGAHHPPLQKPTPIGTFVVQNKLEKMFFYVDGTTTIGGFAPWASRFCEGAYMHGVPVNKPHTKIIEFSKTLGTIPRSHMCVRNASSHAKFIYDNFPVEETLVYVIE